MARKSRVTVPDGIYHITSRISHRALLFKSDELKTRIYKWIFDIAFFSGVEIYSWCIMDNHLHLLVHVPRVPEKYWLDADHEPDAWAFGMRPPECYPPMWATGDRPQMAGGLTAGDRPRNGGMQVENGIKGVWMAQPRPPVGFMLDDQEMLQRLMKLYSTEAAEQIEIRWSNLREAKRDYEVDEEKRRYCRRMYNISQFAKTLKERIAMRYNEEFEHCGCLWQGRFYSGIVENCREVLAVVAGYIDYNPVKAKLVETPERWRFSSWSVAQGNGYEAKRSRALYSKMLGCDWNEARCIMMSVLTDELPEGVDPEDVREYYDNLKHRGVKEEHIDESTGTVPEEPEREDEMEVKLRAGQAIRCSLKLFRNGGYIGRTLRFAKNSVAHLPVGFPYVGFGSIRCCMAMSWKLKMEVTAA